MNKFYVYRYIRLDSNTPFYVGKGSGKRAKCVTYHNDYCKNIAKKYGCLVEIVLDDMPEKRAFEKEMEFIKMYKKLGYCEANFTDGGDGPSGYICKPETKELLRKLNTGKKHSIESRRKISESQLGCAPRSPFTLEIRKKMSSSKKKAIGSLNNFYGKKHNEKTKYQISKSKQGQVPPNRKSILCVNSGTIYPSIYVASLVLKISPKSIRNLCSGFKVKNCSLNLKYYKGDSNDN